MKKLLTIMLGQVDSDACKKGEGKVNNSYDRVSIDFFKLRDVVESFYVCVKLKSHTHTLSLLISTVL